MSAKPPLGESWGAHLRWYREKVRDESRDEFAQAINDLAGDLGENVQCGARLVARWESGEVGMPHPVYRRILAAIGAPSPTVARLPWSRSADVIQTQLAPTLPAASAAGGAEREVLDMAAERARRFAIAAGQTNLTDETLEQVYEDVRQLAFTYPRQPLSRILGDLVLTQDTLFSLLEGRQRPGHTRQLYLLAGVTSGMLAKASHDLADPPAALTQARTAYLCAEQADHDGLRAWIRGLQALVAYWAGRPYESVRYARAGGEAAARSRSTAGAWLAASEARAWAAMSSAEETRAAIERAEASWDHVRPGELDELGGITTFTRTRQLYYAADALVWLPTGAADAERYAEQAVSAYEDTNAPDWAFGDAAGSRADLAIARVMHGEPAGAAEAFAPVLDLPPEQRINGILASAQRVHDAVRRLPASREGRALQEHIEVFTRTPLNALPR